MSLATACAALSAGFIPLMHYAICSCCIALLTSQQLLEYLLRRYSLCQCLTNCLQNRRWQLLQRLNYRCNHVATTCLRRTRLSTGRGRSLRWRFPTTTLLPGCTTLLRLCHLLHFLVNRVPIFLTDHEVIECLTHHVERCLQCCCWCRSHILTEHLADL